MYGATRRSSSRPSVAIEPAMPLARRTLLGGTPRIAYVLLASTFAIVCATNATIAMVDDTTRHLLSNVLGSTYSISVVNQLAKRVYLPSGDLINVTQQLLPTIARGQLCCLHVLLAKNVLPFLRMFGSNVK